MPYVKIINDNQLDIYPESPEMGESYYLGLGYEKWTIDQVNEFNRVNYKFDPESHIYSKYLLKLNLEKIGLWADIKQLMVSQSYWDDFLIAQDLSLNDPKFKSLYEYIKMNYADVDILTILQDSILI